jgi:hypothetical protein
MSPIDDDGAMVWHVAGSLGGSINNGFCLLRGGLSYQMGLMSVLDWRGRQARHGGVAEPEHESRIKIRIRIKREQQVLGVTRAAAGISGKGRKKAAHEAWSFLGSRGVQSV